ncbi:TPA: hypothetical protein HA265_02200 [Candidatus Woesearchaeota archaeon]|nr:hypothetical protein [Candidatus Woesearchaeota archaeon]
MALLNLGKKKDVSVAEQQEVPEELPDLPQGEEQPDEQVEDISDGGVPAELPEVDELAPDELAPIDGVPGSGLGVSQAEVGNVDRRLYFSDLLQKLHQEGLKSTKLTSPSANLLTDMKSYWKQKKKEEELNAMNAELLQNIAPLQRLEKEWVDLQDEIELKKKLLREKEQKIQEMAESLKSLARKTDTASKK